MKEKTLKSLNIYNIFFWVNLHILHLYINLEQWANVNPTSQTRDNPKRGNLLMLLSTKLETILRDQVINQVDMIKHMIFEERGKIKTLEIYGDWFLWLNLWTLTS